MISKAKDYCKYFEEEYLTRIKLNFQFLLILFQLVKSWWGFAKGVLQAVLFTVFWFKLSANKQCITKVLLAIWEIFLHENNCNYNSYKFSYKFVKTRIKFTQLSYSYYSSMFLAIIIMHNLQYAYFKNSWNCCFCWCI